MKVVGTFLSMAGGELSQYRLPSSVCVEVQLPVGIQISCEKKTLSCSVLPTGWMKPLLLHTIMWVSVKKDFNELIRHGEFSSRVFK